MAIIIFVDRPVLGLIKLKGIAKKINTNPEIGKDTLQASSAQSRFVLEANKIRVGRAST